MPSHWQSLLQERKTDMRVDGVTVLSGQPVTSLCMSSSNRTDKTATLRLSSLHNRFIPLPARPCFWYALLRSREGTLAAAMPR